MQIRNATTTLTALAVVAGLAAPALADKIVVRPNDSLQDALNRAQEGDVVVVRGRHVGNVALFAKRGVRIEGSGRKAELIAAPNGSPALRIVSCEDVVVEKLDMTADRYGAVEITESAQVRVSKCKISGPSDSAPAVEVSNSVAVTISRNRFKGALPQAVMLGSADAPAYQSVVSRNKFRRNDGIAIEVHGSQNLILRNSVKHGRDAIVIHGDDEIETNVVRRNRIIKPVGYAVWVAEGATVVDDNFAKLTVKDSLQIDATGSTVTSNKIKNACQHGIDVTASKTSVLGNDVIRATLDGVHVSGDENVLRDNMLKASGDAGIELEGDENRVSNNDFRNNDTAVEDVGEENIGTDLPDAQ